MRDVAPSDCVTSALDTCKNINTPLAPDLGLFLLQTYYDVYNERWSETHGPVNLTAAHGAQVEAFKQQQLYPHIAERERSERINFHWLRTLNDRNYRFSEWATISTNKTGRWGCCCTARCSCWQRSKVGTAPVLPACSRRDGLRHTDSCTHLPHTPARPIDHPQTQREEELRRATQRRQVVARGQGRAGRRRGRRRQACQEAAAHRAARRGGQRRGAARGGRVVGLMCVTPSSNSTQVDHWRPLG